MIPSMTSKQTTSQNRLVTLEHEGKTVTLIGLSDHGPDSLAEADHTLSHLLPDTVCLELCETRRRMLEDTHFWEEATIFETLRRGRGLLLLANMAAATWLDRFGMRDPPRHGRPMLDRANHARKIGAATHLADRDLHITLRRAWHTIGTKRKAGLIFRLLKAMVPWPGRKSADTPPERPIQRMAQLFSENVPEVQSVLLEESDQYFWANIEKAEGNRVVAILDADRIDGLLAVAAKDIDRERLAELPKPSHRLARHSIIMLVIFTVVFVLIARRGENIPWQDMIWAWVLPNSILTGGFAAIGGARFRSILAGMLVSPFTPLSLALRSGIVVGLVEVWLRKPVVRDAETAPRDIRKLETLYRNRMTRVMLVAWLAHTGSSIGNYVGGFLLLRLLA